MAYLYIGPSGKPHQKHSYSAGNTFDQSPLKYFLQKVKGWHERDNKASFLFGRALEESIQFYHDHGGGAIEDFQRRWNAHKETPDLKYTKAEKDWENLYSVGTDMIKLYIIRQPSLPIPLGGASAFQREYSKEVFIGDETYGGIEDAGKLDIVAYVDPAHPSLAKLEWRSEYGMLRPLIVDIKTAAVDFPEERGMAAFDLQLRRYSWLSGIRDVSLLWLKKTSRNIQKGSSITLLEDAGDYKAGEEAVVAKVDDETVWIVRNDFMLGEMENAQGKKADGKTDQTNSAKQRAFEWLQANGRAVSSAAITKQRLQFNSGFVTLESANEAGQIAARQIVEIVNSWKKYKDSTPWPSTFGVRFPKDDRNDPYFRAFVLKDEQFKKEYFKKSDEETLDDLFAEPEGEEE
jgi:hypothetical protein